MPKKIENSPLISKLTKKEEVKMKSTEKFKKELTPGKKLMKKKCTPKNSKSELEIMFEKMRSRSLNPVRNLTLQSNSTNQDEKDEKTKIDEKKQNLLTMKYD